MHSPSFFLYIFCVSALNPNFCRITVGINNTACVSKHCATAHSEKLFRLQYPQQKLLAHQKLSRILEGGNTQPLVYELGSAKPYVSVTPGEHLNTHPSLTSQWCPWFQWVQKWDESHTEANRGLPVCSGDLRCCVKASLITQSQQELYIERAIRINHQMRAFQYRKENQLEIGKILTNLVYCSPKIPALLKHLKTLQTTYVMFWGNIIYS